MTLFEFLAALFEHGRVCVGDWGDVAVADERAVAVLAERELAWRLDFPGEPPPLDAQAAAWAASRFYRACQLAVFRDVDAAIGLAALAAPCPVLASPASHYTIDLVFRFLPDLARLARSAAANDPLVATLADWGAAWPLSSIGMDGVVPTTLDVVASHAGLLRCYADRVIARGDSKRLADPRVAEAVWAALGAHPSLAPDMAAALAEGVPQGTQA